MVSGGMGDIQVCVSQRIKSPASPMRPHVTFGPDLAAVVDAWPELAEAIKAGIVARVKAARS